MPPQWRPKKISEGAGSVNLSEHEDFTSFQNLTSVQCLEFIVAGEFNRIDSLMIASKYFNLFIDS